jgi:predicted DNA-binding transcriptional regulator YafY
VKNLRKRLMRLLGFVDLLKRDRYPNAESYTAGLRQRDLDENQDLGVSVRTVKRDIAFLRDELGAPLEYDSSQGGYVLVDPNWTFPLQPLAGAELFPNVLIGGGSTPPVQPVCREAMFTPVTMTHSPSADIQALLPLLVATNGTPNMKPELLEQLLYSWKNRQVLTIAYSSPRSAVSEREIEVHELFAQEGLWYARAWCRLRNAPRVFALHRITRLRVLEQTFQSAARDVAPSSSGNTFNYCLVDNVVVRSTAESAEFYAEREWFAEQYDRHLADGSLEMLFPQAPRPALVSWVLYNAPELEVLAPEDLRAEIAAKAQALARQHQTSLTGEAKRRFHDH